MLAEEAIQCQFTLFYNILKYLNYYFALDIFSLHLHLFSDAVVFSACELYITSNDLFKEMSCLISFKMITWHACILGSPKNGHKK